MVLPKDHAGLRREFHLFAFAFDNVGRASGKADTEAANGVAEDGANQGATAGADRSTRDIACDVMFFLDNLPFLDSHVPAPLAVCLAVRLLYRNDAHLHTDEAAIQLDGAEGDVNVGPAAENHEMPGFL